MIQVEKTSETGLSEARASKGQHIVASSPAAGWQGVVSLRTVAVSLQFAVNQENRRKNWQTG